MSAIKIIIILMLLAVLSCLGAALVSLLRGQTGRTVKALTLRIALSFGLFILLMITFATGLITPHGL